MFNKGGDDTMTEIRGKRVLITGASSGIGKALALALGKKGAVLALAARRTDRLEHVAVEISTACSHLPKPLVFYCDVANKENVIWLVERSIERMGGIDILVNNAGIGVYGSTAKTSVSDIRRILDVNFFGAVHCILEVLPHMTKKGEGHIVNIASVAAKHGVPYLGAYGAGKAALVALSQSLRAELSGSGISVSVVYPGYTQTEFFAKEKHVGGGRRPAWPYESPEKVAKNIIRKIEKNKQEIVLSLEGKVLSAVQGILPRIVDLAMERIAHRLREPKEVSNEKAKITDYRALPKLGR
jgi:short-subunit dehydrogenase